MVERARRVLLDGLGFAEGPRWHDGRLWFSDMGSAEVLAVDLGGKLQRIASVEARPSGLGWLPDGTLLVVSMGDRRLLRMNRDGTLAEHADLSKLASHDCNDMVVDGHGRAYVGNAGFDLRQRPLQLQTAELVLVTPDGDARIVDETCTFPNGAVVTPDGSTLIVAETFGRRLSAFTITDDGSLVDRRVWAELPGRSPDGICLDAEGAIWVADAVGQAAVRVMAGGEIADRVTTDRNCFACMLGGPDRATLFLCVAEGFSGAAIRQRSATIEAVDVDVQGAGWP